jgi:hypothetical protein
MFAGVREHTVGPETRLRCVGRASLLVKRQPLAFIVRSSSVDLQRDIAANEVEIEVQLMSVHTALDSPACVSCISNIV